MADTDRHSPSSEIRNTRHDAFHIGSEGDELYTVLIQAFGAVDALKDLYGRLNGQRRRHAAGGGTGRAAGL